jgi:predicted neutral ceramidase superfamily lipid hydrolase
MANQRRRLKDKLGQLEARRIVSMVIAGRLVNYDALHMEPIFEMVMRQVHGRGPTDGERDLYYKEFGKMVDALVLKGSKAKEDLELREKKKVAPILKKMEERNKKAHAKAEKEFSEKSEKARAARLRKARMEQKAAETTSKRGRGRPRKIDVDLRKNPV